MKIKICFIASVKSYPICFFFWGTARSTCLYERRYPEVPGVLKTTRGYLLTEAMTCTAHRDPGCSRRPPWWCQRRCTSAKHCVAAAADSFATALRRSPSAAEQRTRSSCHARHQVCLSVTRTLYSAQGRAERGREWRNVGRGREGRGTGARDGGGLSRDGHSRHVHDNLDRGAGVARVEAESPDHER